MAELKYEKYILNDLRLPERVKPRAAEYEKKATRIFYMEDEIIEGADSVIISWYWKVTADSGTPSHVHDFDEVVGLIGNDPKNPFELGAEVEFWLEDEKYILDKSTLIWVPKGLRHCPLRVLKVDRPILFLAFSTTKKYLKDGVIHDK